MSAYKINTRRVTLQQEATMPFIELGAEGEPLNTYFLLNILEGKKDCPRFYGETGDKITVSEALQYDIHVEVKSKWGELRCHCNYIPFIRLSKTARNFTNIANHLFHLKVKGWSHLPDGDRQVAEYLQKKKDKGELLSTADEKFLQSCDKYKEWKPKPGEETYERNPALIAQAVAEDWSFGFLPEKVCSLASHCKKQLKKGFVLDPLKDRFFAANFLAPYHSLVS